MRIILLVIPILLAALAEARRPAIRPRVPEPQVYYQEEDSQAAEDDFSPAVYQPRTRALSSPRSKDTLHSSKAPPVQTIRNYNKVNDDGSFTFGYEAADGSFKEETRGTDCVVRGKYGYIDPDGNKREFTYVSGNPCDPNAPKEDEDDLAEKQEEEELNGPANYPAIRPVPRPLAIRPSYQQSTTRAPTTIFHTEYQLDDNASQELEEQELAKPAHARPADPRRPQSTYVQVIPSTLVYESSPSPSPAAYRATTSAQYQTTSAPPPRTQPTAASTVYHPLETSTRKPVARHPRPQSVAITPRPHVAQVAAQYVSPSSTEQPRLAYTPGHPSAATLATNPRPTTVPAAAHLDFAAELERYVNTVSVPAPSRPAHQSARVKLTGQSPVGPIYQSELVYDPSTAQPQSLLGLQQLQAQPSQRQSPVYKQAQPQEVLYRKQQAQLLQQSQQLYAQQQRRQQQQQQPQQQQSQQQQQQPQKLQLLESQRQPQSFYYVSPGRTHGPAPLSVGQIDQFLRSGGNAY
ncbi:hypothetical protein KM043_002412 [Ampulex compressa]|nr:hypothetical protein KM043_002412 [Ampulex compressa]